MGRAVTRIVIAYDGSAPARAAVDRAGALLPDAAALIVSVADGLDAIDEAAASARIALPDAITATAVHRMREAAVAGARMLADEGARLARAAGLDATPRFDRAGGSVLPVLLQAAGDADAELIVCGTRGQGAVTRMVLGSVSLGLTRHAELPVLVVPADAVSAQGPVMIGYDGSEHADRAVDVCARLFGPRTVTVVRVWASPLRHTITGRILGAAPFTGSREIVQTLEGLFAQQAEQLAQRGAGRARERGLTASARSIQTRTSTSETLLRAAAEEHATAIVVGRSGAGALSSMVHGSVSSSLMHATDRSLLVVP